MLRGNDFSKSDSDVRVPDFPFLRIDAKAYKKFAHHTLMREIVDKYCKRPGDIPVLVTKHERQVGMYVTVPLDFFAHLLEIAREEKARKRYKLCRKKKP